MLIKNLSRKGGGSAPVLKYVFKYIYRKTTPVKRGRHKVNEYSDTVERQRDRIGYVRALRSAEVQFTKKDIDYLMRNLIDAKLNADFVAKTGGRDYVKYIQDYLLNTTKEKENQPFVMTHNIKPYKDINDIIRNLSRMRRVVFQEERIALQYIIR